MVWSTNADDAEMLVDIHFPMNLLIIEKSTLNLIDICVDNTLQISRKLLPRFAKIEKIDRSNIA